MSGSCPKTGPAPGCRHSNFGTLFDIGHHGYSCSTAVSGNNARFMFFGSSGIGPQTAAYRAYGIQVRCLQE